jgi:hypothetical protein
MRALPYPAVLRYESTRQLNGSRSLKALACTPHRSVLHTF